MEPDPSAGLHDLEAALVRWRALTLLGDLQRRAYLEQAASPEPPGEGERLYRGLALRLAREVLVLRARVAELEHREEVTTDAEDPAP